jgi:chromosome segregation ATPase
MFWIEKLKNRLRALGNRIAALQVELHQATARIDALSTRLEEAERRYDEAERRLERERHDDQSGLTETIGRLEGLAGDQAAVLALQATALEALGKASEQQEHKLEQLQTDLARTQRQAELDLAEMRETNTAMAASILLRRARPADNLQ